MSTDRNVVTLTRAGFHVTLTAAPDYYDSWVDLVRDGGAVVQTWDRGWSTLGTARAPDGRTCTTFTDAGHDFEQPERPAQCDGGWAAVTVSGSSQGETSRVWYRIADVGDRARFERSVRDMARGIVSPYHVCADVRAEEGGPVIGRQALGGVWLHYREAEGEALITAADDADIIGEAIHEARRNAPAVVDRLRYEADAIAFTMRRDADAIAAACANV